MPVLGALIAKSGDSVGLEDPSVVFQHALTILGTRQWQFYLAYSIGSVLCGFMVLFLVGVSLWRPALVNRVSLRIIFAISIYDFIVCLLQATAMSESPSARCRTRSFFSTFFGYVSVYTSSSIAVNLHMTLLRSKRTYLPRYVEYLYFIVPLLVALLHWAPPTIWAAAHNICSAFEPIEPGTPGFILYVIFVQLFLPFIALTYNVVTSLRVIFMLHSQQRQLNQTLREIMQESNDRYMGNIDDEPHTSIVVDSEKVGLRSLKTRRELEANIIVMRRFNSAVIRIALYPFAPIAWWIINAAYYGIQYPLTMTHTEDANRWVSMASLAWFSMPAIAIANFLVFVTDPAFVKVVKQVHKRVLSRFISKRAIHAEQADNTMYAFKPIRSTSPLPGDFDTLVSKHGVSRKPQITETSNADNMSLGSIFESPYTPPDFEAEASAPTNKPTPQGQSSSVMHAYGEMVRRHPTVGNNTDANLFYSRM